MSDIRHAFRVFLREPGFALVATVVLALGIGATTAIFTLVYSLLLEPLPYPDSGKLVWISGVPPRPGQGIVGVLGADFLEFRDRSRSYERMAALIPGLWIFSGGGDAQNLAGARVTPGFFETLGIQPALGRVFVADEHRLGHEMEVIFSNSFWRQRYGGDPGVIGRHVTLDGIPYEVVGVAPAGFPLGEQFDMWAPLQMDSAYGTGRRFRMLRPFGRLKDGVRVEQAQAEATGLAADFEQRYANDKGYALKVDTFLDHEVGGIRKTLWIFAAAVGCLLLIACSNVASLLLARGAVRVREMAVRAAVGASRAVLIRQMLVESCLLALAGGGLGFALGVAGVRALTAIGSGTVLPRAQEIHADWRVLLFTFLISLATGSIFGIVPALRGSRVNPGEALRESGRGGTGGRRANRFRAALVVVEVALGVVLMANAVLLTRTFRALTRVEPGYHVKDVLTLQILLLGPRYRSTAECRRFFDRVLASVEQIPGVEAVGTTNWLPLKTDKNTAGLWVDTQPLRTEETKIRMDNRVVTPGYFRAMGAPLLDGRLFDANDTADSPHVMLVNDAFAREFYPNGGAVGHRITIDIGTPWEAEIVGVVGSFRESSIAEQPRREVFTAYSQTTIAGQSLVVRTKGDPAGYAAAVRGAIASIDPDNAPIYNLRTMQAQVDESLAQHRMRGVLLGIFSVVALALASLGVYGVISCAVAERRQEIGIRMALGAERGQVLRLMLSDGLKLTAWGLALGLAGAAVSTRLLQTFLFGVTPGDPLTFVGTAAVFMAVALAASFLPARRATRVDPIAVLREE
jgi:putative ABC transport system permease protein